MKTKFKEIRRAWFIAACIAASLNLIWFYCNTAKSGNRWPDRIGPVPVLFMSFATIFVGALVYWLLSYYSAKAWIYFAIGSLIVAMLSVMGHPQLSDGSVVPPAFRFMDIPMHFIAGLACAFLVPAICRGKIFKNKIT